MAVQSLKAQSTAPSLDASGDRSHRGRLTNDQENFLQQDRVVTIESRSQNVSPSQKTAFPRWRHKGREKSSIILACTWVVDHQISMRTSIPILRCESRLHRLTDIYQASPSTSYPYSSSRTYASPRHSTIPKSSLAFLITIRTRTSMRWAGTTSSSSFSGSLSSRAPGAPRWIIFYGRWRLRLASKRRSKGLDLRSKLGF